MSLLAGKKGSGWGIDRPTSGGKRLPKANSKTKDSFQESPDLWNITEESKARKKAVVDLIQEMSNNG